MLVHTVLMRLRPDAEQQEVDELAERLLALGQATVFPVATLSAPT